MIFEIRLLAACAIRGWIERRLLGRIAAINQIVATRDKRGLVGTQKGDQIRHFLWLAHAAHDFSIYLDLSA
jgi:hypothetical protein